VSRLSILSAGVVFVLVVLMNFMYDGFPLTHVTRPDPRFVFPAAKLDRHGKPVRASLSPMSPRWDARALGVNAIICAELMVGVGVAGALIERRARRANLQTSAVLVEESR
jgi:hypothetical protein